MSVTTIDVIRGRIASAEPESPIAVFRTGKHGMLKSLFANTVITKDRIERRDPALVGVYHSGDDEQRVAQELFAAAHETVESAAA